MLAYVHCRVIVEAKCLITHDSWSCRSPRHVENNSCPVPAFGKEQNNIYLVGVPHGSRSSGPVSRTGYECWGVLTASVCFSDGCLLINTHTLFPSPSVCWDLQIQAQNILPHIPKLTTNPQQFWDLFFYLHHGKSFFFSSFNTESSV